MDSALIKFFFNFFKKIHTQNAENETLLILFFQIWDLNPVLWEQSTQTHTNSVNTLRMLYTSYKSLSLVNNVLDVENFSFRILNIIIFGQTPAESIEGLLYLGPTLG